MYNITFKHLLLVIIILLGIALRVINVQNNPPAMYGDELTAVYDAYSILHTGHDQKGNFLPLTFELGDSRPAGYIYFSIPFVLIFGPTELGIRSLSILSGIGLILLMYLLGKELFNKNVGLATAFLIAISPWDINLSRGGFETHYALFLTVLGVVCFLISRRRPYLLIFTAISFSLTFNTYSTYKLTIPLILILLIWFSNGLKWLFNKEYKKYTLISLIILTCAGILLLTQILTAGSEQRFLNINVFNQADLTSTITQKINAERNLSTLPKTITPLFYNRMWEYGSMLVAAYVNNFSWNFLFIDGDKNPRHNMSLTGQFYFVEIILIALGLFVLASHKKKLFYFLISWILIAPLPTTLILVSHALRSSLMLPPMILFSSLGLVHLYQNINRKVIKVVSIIVVFGLVFEFIFFINQIFFLAPNEFGSFWADSAKTASEIASKNKNNYKYVILADRIDNIEFAYPVYGRIDPNVVIAQNKQQDSLGKYKFRKYGNVYIGSVSDSAAEDFLSGLTGSVLYVGPAQDTRYLIDYQTVKGGNNDPILVVKTIPKNEL